MKVPSKIGLLSSIPSNGSIYLLQAIGNDNVDGSEWCLARIPSLTCHSCRHHIQCML